MAHVVDLAALLGSLLPHLDLSVRAEVERVLAIGAIESPKAGAK